MRKNERLADGTERLIIRNTRNFTYNGRKYYIADLDLADRERTRMKYMITEVIDGKYTIMHNCIDWELPKFKTLKDAMRYVRDTDSFLREL